MSARRTILRAPSLLAGLVGVVLAVPLLGTAPADAGRPERLEKRAPIVELRGARHEFSPDQDGYHDRLSYRLVVHRRALVYLSVVDTITGESIAGLPGAGTSDDDQCLTIGKHRCQFAKGSYRLDVTRLVPSRFRYSSSGYAPGRFRLVLEALTVAGPDRYQRLGRTVDVTRGLLLGERAPYTRTKTATLKQGAGAKLRIPYRLEARSRMTAVFLRTPTGGPEDYAPYATTPIGRRDRGQQAWTWDGTIDGEQVPPGVYLVDLEAQRVGAKPSYHYVETVVTVS